MSQLVITRADDLETAASQTVQESVSDGLLFGDSAVGVEPGVAPDWQLDTGHYEPAIFAQHVIYPRPNAETNTYARHRWAYPGIKYEIPIGVQFGSWPFRYEMISGPSWLSIEAETLEWDGTDKFIIPSGYGILSGTAPGTDQAAEAVTVRVYDQEHNRPDPSFVDVTFTVEVKAAQFAFLDPVNGDDSTGDGTIGSPYKEVSALQDADLGQLICYVRDTTALADGYIPSPARQFRFGTALEPVAYIGYPGETVLVNCKDQSGFSNGRIDDLALHNIGVKDTNQTNQDAANVQVIQHGIGGNVKRGSYWRLTNTNSYGGTAQNDNFGFIIFFDEGEASAGNGQGYLYFCEVDGDQMTGGGNGPAVVEVMAAYRNLIERCSVTNSSGSNVGFFGYKHTSTLCEIRACDEVVSNSHNRALWFHANDDDGFNSSDCMISYCRTDNQVTMGAFDPGGANATGMHVIRCTARELVGNTPAISEDNVSDAAPPAGWTSTGDVDLDWASDLDGDLNLVGSARTTHLGTKGAEVA